MLINSCRQASATGSRLAKLIGLTLALFSVGSAQQLPLNVKLYSGSRSSNASITAGPDGNVWVGADNAVEKFDPTGTSTTFDLSFCGFTFFTRGIASVTSIASGSDGAIWFVATRNDSGSSTLGRLSIDGLTCSTYYTTVGKIGALVAGPDGALWFTYSTSIGRITTTGQVTTFPVPLPWYESAHGIIVGPDGALWFTTSRDIWRITTAGQPTAFLNPDQNATMEGITAGPDGALWFTEYDSATTNDMVGRLTTSGSFTQRTTLGPYFFDIVAGSDGALWSSGLSCHCYPQQAIFARVTTGGNVSVSAPVPGVFYYNSFLTAGPDGNIWFAQRITNIVGEILLQKSPITSATLNGPTGNNGWYRGGVTVTLSAIETAGSIASTWFSVDGAAYLRYTAPFSISAEGAHQLAYYSVDSANQQETPRTQAVKIDATAPVSSIAALPAIETSPAFPVQWSVIETGSGLNNVALNVSDNGGPLTLLSSATTTSGQRNFTGVCGHRYGFFALASDNAGNVEGPKTAPDATTTVLGAVSSRVGALSGAVISPNFNVRWSETDPCSSMSSYTVYVSDNGGPFTPWLSTGANGAYYPGSLGHTYGFYSIGQTYAGVQETAKTIAEANIQLPAQMAIDVNGDSWVNCTDVSLVKASVGTKTGQPGFNPKADVNSDGIVNVVDLSLVTRGLIPGTPCP
jgi:streptogramin lyase